MSKKGIVTVLICVLVVVAAPFAMYQTYKTSATNNCKEYLSQKYSADKTDFECVKFSPSHHEFNDDAIPVLEKSNNMWVFLHNDKEFFVYYEDGKYYDDYQLDELERLCTEWLQKNIDSEIIGVEMDIRQIAAYQKTIDNTKPISKDEIEYFLKAGYTYNEYVDIFVKSGADEKALTIRSNVSNKLGESLGEKTHVFDEEKFGCENRDWCNHYGIKSANI